VSWRFWRRLTDEQKRAAALNVTKMRLVSQKSLAADIAMEIGEMLAEGLSEAAEQGEEANLDAGLDLAAFNLRARMSEGAA